MRETIIQSHFAIVFPGCSIELKTYDDEGEARQGFENYAPLPFLDGAEKIELVKIETLERATVLAVKKLD